MTTKRRSALIDATLMGTTKTFNDCATNPTSLDACVDLFFLAGASRTMPEKNILNVFSKAYAEDPNTAMKLLFWTRDIRGGSGERRFFQIVSKWLAEMHPESINKNIKFIPEYGRWKDIFEFDTNIIVPLIIEGLNDGIRAKDMLEKIQMMSEEECGEVLFNLHLSK